MGVFVVIASNSDRKVAVFGTATGRPFGSLQSAERAARRFEKRHPNLSALACFVEAEETKGEG
jgi:hypothetical protein